MFTETRSIFEALQREIGAAGPGAISRVQKAAGVGENYLRHLRLRLEAGQERGFNLGVLLLMLEALGVEKGAFFAGTFRARDPLERLRAETARLGEPPEIVARVRQLLAAAAWAPGAEAPNVRRLDDHRFGDPRHTLRLISAALDQVEAGLAPRWTALPLLAVWGSARRMVCDQPRLVEAQQALIAAYQLAEPGGDPATLGDLLQRLAYVVADRGYPRRALALTDLAILRHTVACHRRGVGRSLVDRGMWLYDLGKPRQAIEAQKAALKNLPDDEQRTRFSAFRHLGLTYRELGNPESARHYAKLAARCSDEMR